jgi:hypothetical protein
MSDEQANRQRLLRYVMLAVLAWGSLLAVGALLYGIDPVDRGVRFSPNIWRGLIVESVVVGFVGLWWLAVRRR